MSGLYIHIPFCRKACHYCNFHFSTSLASLNDMCQAMIKEMNLRKDEINTSAWQSLYFGGGTPSLIPAKSIQAFIDEANSLKPIDSSAEITLEANPDDLDKTTLKNLKDTSINRLSIGIQSFEDEDLKFMSRIHSAMEAEDSIKRAQDMGFENITIDLIYGTPTLSNKAWINNLNKANNLGINHISAYALTVEPKTVLAHLIKTGKLQALDDQKSAEQMQMLVTQLNQFGFEHYETSNFAKKGHRAVHNSNYWLRKPYLGIGPSAHSFDGDKRRSWNITNNALYLKSIEQNTLNSDFEILSNADIYNELVLTRLRTIWGLPKSTIQEIGFLDYFANTVQKPIEQGLILVENDTYFLSSKGKLWADRISQDLFYLET